MSVLVDREIEEILATGFIVIEPYDRKHLGTNSYDVHLAPVLRTYKVERDFTSSRHLDRLGRAFDPTPVDLPLDVRVPRETVDVSIPDHGYVLEPGELYLGATAEYTESHRHLPIVNGKSSLGRLGLSIHVTAGTGDVGFCGHWTLELFVVKRLRIYAGMAIGQLLWFSANTPDVPYNAKKSAKYNNHDPLPMRSQFYWGEE